MQSNSTGGAPSPTFAYVLDDDERIGSLVCQFLFACGFQPKQFSTPLPFFTETRMACPELVLLDLALGESDAVDVIRHLEVLKFKGNVLLISGRDRSVLNEIEAIGTAHGLAMLPPLQKPFRLADLKASLAASTDVVALDKPPALSPPAHQMVDLAEALRKNWLEVWYQPKVDLRTRLVCGAEALLRARHPVQGLVLPIDILPPTHDPLYQPLTRFVLRQALADWGRFADHQIILKLAVNVPVSVLCAPEFIRGVRELVPADARFPGLIIEITEDEVVRDAEAVREIAAQLKIYNTSLSIDDFGAAYSSLSRLLEVPCAELKIDRQFVANCSVEPLKHALCQSVVDLAHRVGVTVCAEGIETAGDLRTLIEIDCDTAQGFLFAKPMKADILIDMLVKKRMPPAGMASPAERRTAGNQLLRAGAGDAFD
jgi:EAL domain-containing protein (putative c-di-GMP-specific phosphodiesterase class I)/FixJ family two-component response regulator